MGYPDKSLVVDVLAEAARRAGSSVTARHPEDIAIAMINALEYAAEIVQILHEGGNLQASPSKREDVQYE